MGDWIGSRKETWYEHLLPQPVTDAINTSPTIGALARYLNAQPSNLTAGIQDQYGSVADRDWLLQQAGGRSLFDRLHPHTQNTISTLGLLANFVGPPAAKLPAPWAGRNQEWIHGTGGTHTSLDSRHAGRVSSGAGDGIWLTEPTERIYASEYAQRGAEKIGGNPRILRFRADGVENPLEVRMDFDKNAFIVDGKLRPDWTSNNDVLRYAQGRGHDAVHWLDGSFSDPPSLTVFDGSKLKYLGE